MPTVIDELTHESLAIRVDRKLKSTDVIDVLSDLFILRGVPGQKTPVTLLNYAGAASPIVMGRKKLYPPAIQSSASELERRPRAKDQRLTGSCRPQRRKDATPFGWDNFKKML
jgi:hypothetical protein